jgi:hypothetical protein
MPRWHYELGNYSDRSLENTPIELEITGLSEVACVQARAVRNGLPD